jgi:hypothetical protein
MTTLCVNLPFAATPYSHQSVTIMVKPGVLA